MEKNQTISISNYKNTMTPESIEDAQFTKVHFRIYSADTVNDHNYTCSLNVLKKYSNTIAGKPILVWYNKFANNGNGDFAGHEDSSWAKEYSVGFFPNDVKVTYEKDDDGTVFLCADGYIWTVYYSEIIKVFKNYGGIKGVSCEMLVIDSEIIEGTDIENILQYSFSAVTLIGEHDAFGTPIKPAVDGCQGVLVTNASINAEYEKAKTEFEKTLYQPLRLEPNGSFFNQKNKEACMDKNTVNSTIPSDVAENATQETTTSIRVSTDTVSFDDNGNYVGFTYENHYVQETEVKEAPERDDGQDGTTVDNAVGKECNTSSPGNTRKLNTTQESDAQEKEGNPPVTTEEFEAIKEKCSSLEKELAEKDTEIKKLLEKCAALESYRNNKENENMKTTIELALNSVSHILSTDQIDNWRKESKKCSSKTIDGFINKLKAFAFDIQEKNGITQKDTIRNSIPKETINEPTDFWDRMDKKYN